MNKLVKYLFISLLLSSSAFCQNIEQENEKDFKKKKAINEISYQYPLALGYSHIRNINGKFLLGFGLHLGYGAYWPKYSDFFFFKIYSRNLFNQEKLNKRFDYDIGIFTSFSFQQEVILFGLNSSAYYNIYKFKIGLDMLVAGTKNNSEIITIYPLLAPVLIFQF